MKKEENITEDGRMQTKTQVGLERPPHLQDYTKSCRRLGTLQFQKEIPLY